MPTGSPVAPHGKDCDSSTRHLILAATIHVRQEVQALPRGAARRVALSRDSRNPPCYPPSHAGASARKLATVIHSLGRLNFLTIRGGSHGIPVGLNLTTTPAAERARHAVPTPSCEKFWTLPCVDLSLASQLALPTMPASKPASINRTATSSQRGRARDTSRSGC
jgi:hypothetical protein